jgi:hypothetical protein
MTANWRSLLNALKFLEMSKATISRTGTREENVSILDSRMICKPSLLAEQFLALTLETRNLMKK